jgi:TolB-like protein/Tfp pilus assembly protein PilF
MASESSSPPAVFLSYAHADQAKAQRLATALAQHGFVVWWDKLIEGGAQFAKSIRQALEAADAVVVLWSKYSIESDWVCDEAAQGRDRRRLVPLSLDGSLPPLGFRQYQTIDLARWRGRADAPQIDAIRRAIAIALGERPLAPRPALVGWAVDRRRMIVGSAGTVAVLAGGGLIAWQSGLLGPAAADAHSIAVLPFRNLSGDASQAYLSDGLTEEVRSALARNAGLMVLAGTSSNSAREAGGDARSIARKLTVAYLLEGSVQRAGDTVRVATNLTNGRTGFSLWSQRVERRLDDIFQLQSDIARMVSNALAVRMATDDPAPGGTRNVRAYEAYSRGRALYNLAKDEATDREALAHYEVAIAADPKFALAHAGRSRVLASIAASHAEAAELKPLYTAAVGEARRAIALAPALAEGHLALGYARFAGFLDVRGAKPSYDKARELGSGNADIMLLYALYTVRARRFAEAKAAIERAVVLDPLNPRSHRAAGTIAYASRDYERAIGYFRRALALNPTMSNANAMLGNSLIELGRLDEARVALSAEKSAMFRLTGLAVLEHRAGNRAAAQRAFDQLVADAGDAALYQQAQVKAQWGQTDEAITLLRQAREVGDPGLTAIASDPALDPLQRNPRYRALVRELGFASPSLSSSGNS